MTAGAIARVIRAPGRVVVDPTNLSNAYPHGGTEVGKSQAFVLTSLASPPFRVECEGLGDASDVLEQPKDFAASVVLRGWDDDAVAQFHSDGYAVGGKSGHAVDIEPASSPGSTAIGRACIILYVPDDIIHVPALLLYRAIPYWPEATDIAYERGTEFGLPVAFVCIRNAAGKILQRGIFADLSLTP
ncbi:hypothetical protein CMI37_23435 [Candidatus Pacearchaeota archaeon]|jgi:hypothetical protein|nr:hypothetical protein [Candidatus Pacearchaeota archaeon]|tara:strand:- start:1509 stop:2069 length:561 start_codon:yes stop_codon:yes gene_type:complete